MNSGASTRLYPSFLDLIRETEFIQSVWNRSWFVWKNAIAPADFINGPEIQAKLDASLLKWPYFTLLQNGHQHPTLSYTTTRDVIGQKRGGFPDADKIRRFMEAGASLKLNQLSDWHRPTRDLHHSLEELLPVAVTSYIFWTPAENRGMLPHRDAAHVLALQLEGRKEWHLYAGEGQVASTAGLDVESLVPSHQFVLEPGDVLYLPHGWPHDAIALDGRSLHLTFTLAQPAPEDLVDALLEHFKESRSDLVHRHHTRTLEDKSEEVRAALLAEVETLDSEAWLASALSIMRKANQ